MSALRNDSNTGKSSGLGSFLVIFQAVFLFGVFGAFYETEKQAGERMTFSNISDNWISFISWVFNNIKYTGLKECQQLLQYEC